MNEDVMMCAVVVEAMETETKNNGELCLWNTL